MIKLKEKKSVLSKLTADWSIRVPMSVRETRPKENIQLRVEKIFFISFCNKHINNKL